MNTADPVTGFRNASSFSFPFLSCTDIFFLTDKNQLDLYDRSTATDGRKTL